ncbi:hypothetical protein [Promicromonospora iranensis]|uniref:Uncharacterized protein n=1 Tax=Promicromonospora iranensis TaxID=1105144 RepID=A0ABU2CRP5_9MICO|nr:hypothetical protein [Promicromonospora iranensis]MDR7383956.1 hypothetical protein [Promicromonospora iranensis]
MRDTMDGTFSMSPSGGNAFSEFARVWRSRMGERFALPPYSRETVSGFRVRSRGSARRTTCACGSSAGVGGTAAAGSADAAGVRLLTAHATMVSRLLDDLEPAGVDAARETLAELARAVVHGGLDDVEPRLAAALAQAARDIADRRLTDPTLSPTILARQLNVSVRTLQRAFAAEG